MRKTVCLIGAGLAILAGTALTVLPTPNLFGMDPGSVAAIYVALATAVATVLVWYGVKT